MPFQATISVQAFDTRANNLQQVSLTNACTYTEHDTETSRHFVGDTPVYMLLYYDVLIQLVKKQIETWSEKICRGIWRQLVYVSFLPYLKAFNFDDTSKMTLLDVSRFALPDIADPQWASLVNLHKTGGVQVQN